MLQHSAPTLHLNFHPHLITMTPPPERGRSGLPRRSFLPPMTAPTPHFRRTAETPLGKIQPDLEGFALAEMSDLLEPLTPAPFVPAPFPAPFPSIQRRASPPDSETGLYKGNHRALAQDRVKAGKHRTPDTKRRRRDELFTPGAPIHSDDLFSRRLADSARRTPLAPLPLEHFDEPAPPRPSSSLAVVTAPVRHPFTALPHSSLLSLPFLSLSSLSHLSTLVRVSPAWKSRFGAPAAPCTDELTPTAHPTHRS